MVKQSETPWLKFYYVYLNLESSVQAMVLPQLSQAEELESWNYNTILEQLSRVNFNPNKIQEAEDKLLALKQSTDSLPAYVAKFERILYEAKGQNWPDVNKISTFRSGLNSIIRARLSQQLNHPPILNLYELSNNWPANLYHNLKQILPPVTGPDIAVTDIAVNLWILALDQSTQALRDAYDAVRTTIVFWTARDSEGIDNDTDNMTSRYRLSTVSISYRKLVDI